MSRTKKGSFIALVSEKRDYNRYKPRQLALEFEIKVSTTLCYIQKSLSDIFELPLQSLTHSKYFCILNSTH